MQNASPLSCHELFARLQELTRNSQLIYNFTALVAMNDYTITTELFDQATLEAYSAYNLGLPLSPQQQSLFSEERGGPQGDYRSLMQEKITNVVDCLTRYPHSKRALITIAPDPCAPHYRTDLAKCLREIYFRCDQGLLHASCVFRAQAVSIFPKNLHFIGSLMELIAGSLEPKLAVGTLFYYAVQIGSERNT